LWAYVIVAPDDNKIVVFRRGIWNGLKGLILVGGHCAPNSMLGDKLE